MPGGRRNPFSVSHIIERVEDAVQNAKSNPHDMASIVHMHKKQNSFDVRYVDLQIQFIGASGLPKMDVVGSADPYFVAKIDNKISFVSNVKSDTLAPIWNEMWRIKHVPTTAELQVEVLDKDEGAPHDDYVGKFKTTVSPGAKEVEIEGPLLKLRRSRGTFWIKIESKPSSDPRAPELPYLFDGPIRFSRHYSPTVGLLTNLDDARLYSTWKIYIIGVPLYFRDRYQPWNRSYKAAQSIFQGPTSLAVRSGIQAGHRMLYARTANNGFGLIENPSEIFKILHGGASRPGAQSGAQFAHRVKPAVYTYIISAEDDSFRFSETGAAFFVDFASKHALHSNCAEQVRYSGDDDTPDDQVQWELVIDNNLDYSPDPTMLPDLKELLEQNFHGFTILALSFEDPQLKESREACRAYALKYRGVEQSELQPHAGAGEVTLCHQASARAQEAESGGEPPATEA
ncbi:hypothetical protein BD779DRAFT_1519083 [Infundibulicybe gibba]|nr:hypothetical protein BD779DRAFT_1519083 [Infundibulicybe gibba]